MLLALALLFAAGWIVAFVVLHVTSFAIHLLLVIALISLVLHLMRRRAT